MTRNKCVKWDVIIKNCSVFQGNLGIVSAPSLGSPPYVRNFTSITNESPEVIAKTRDMVVLDFIQLSFFPEEFSI